MPVPSPRELAQAARRPSGRAAADPAPGDAHPGEVQLLRLLLLRPECREAGLELDADIFEHGLNRLLFEAWRKDDAFEERIDELGEDLQAHYVLLAEKGLSQGYEAMTGSQIREVVRTSAQALRERRRRERLSAESLAVAHDVAEARRGGADMLEFARRAYERGPLPPGTTNAEAELAATLVELSRQQRGEIQTSAPQGVEEVADGIDSGDNGSTTWTD